MILQILKRLPFFAVLTTAIAFSISGSAPVGGEFMNQELVPLDGWVLQNIKHPGLAFFCFGILVAWGIYELVNSSVYEKRKRTRIQLAKLRDDGVKIRNKCVSVTPANVPGWIERTEQWNADTIKTIAKMDHADSMWFATLDSVPNPRIPIMAFSHSQDKSYREHDFRLVKLEQLMEKYREQG